MIRIVRIERRREYECEGIASCEMWMEPRYRIEKGRSILYILAIPDVICYVLDHTHPEEVSIGRRMSRIEYANHFFLWLEFWMHAAIVPEVGVFTVELPCIDRIESIQRASKNTREYEGFDEKK